MSTGLPMNFVVERQGDDVRPHRDAPDNRRRPRRFRQASHGSSRACLLSRQERREGRKVRPCDLRRLGRGAGMVHRQSDREPISSGFSPGRESTDQMSGLIGAAQMAGEMAKISLWELFSLAAWFSVSVGLMNLLPIPLLDGGHLAFYAFEALRGRPLSERAQEIGLRIGIALVALLVVFTTSHDLFRLVSSGN